MYKNATECDDKHTARLELYVFCNGTIATLTLLHYTKYTYYSRRKKQRKKNTFDKVKKGNEYVFRQLEINLHGFDIIFFLNVIVLSHILEFQIIQSSTNKIQRKILGRM